MSIATKARTTRTKKPPTAEQKAEWAQARQDKLTGLMNTLAASVETLAGEDEWKAMLEVAKRFHRYSPNNVMLIMAQMPAATRVAGFRTWQSLGRQVRKGERGITILAPMKGKREVEDADTGEKSTVAFMRGFTGAAVFDISQTDGDPLPELTVPLLEGEADEAVLAQVAALVQAEGFTFDLVEAIPAWPGAKGLTDFMARTVVVRQDLSGRQQLKTAVHELAHVLLHGPDHEHVAREVGEVEAESTAYVVLGALGDDTSAYSTGYVAGWANGDPERVKTTTARVIGTAHRILEALQPEQAEVVAA